ncbi:hypothetical protein [Myxococcus sp. RHSTA-1-4]|uniref:hypothetical protein n=1 Tax=Myxococcus sp. RHSTA-1-4 TaxID=2874601 RepID=UPI001CBAC00C|nr:hypothetical protein [Myxococcus sp. RHSTA-1-4]MBZ4420564.1 hypothetical protein [Myxococcus sp. RHSTA-1-4]
MPSRSASHFKDASNPAQCVSRCEPVDRLRWRAFSLLEQLAAGPETGELGLMSERGALLGRLLMVNGRMGLVEDVAGLPRLSTMLEQESPEAADHLNHAAQRARAEGRLLGTVLLELQPEEMERIRRVLLRQFALGVLAVARASEGPLPLGVWRHAPDVMRVEESRLSGFPLEEVALEIGRATDDGVPDIASRLLDECGDSAQVALLFSREEDDGELGPYPLQLKGLPATGLGELRELSSSVRQMLRPPALCAAGVRPRLMMLGGQDSDWVALRGPCRQALVGGLSARGRVEALSRAMRLCREEPCHG